VELAVQNHPPIIASQRTVDELQAQVDQLQEPTGERETDENEASAELKREFGERQAALDQLKETQRDVLRRKHAALHAEEQVQTRQSLRDKTAVLNVKKGVLANRLDAAEKQLEADEGKLISLEFALAQLNREKQVFELIAARKLRLETEHNAPDRVALMVTARPPESPDPKVALWKLGLICGLAFLLPLVVARFWPARAA
jgi:chromosome segregation ATPase